MPWTCPACRTQIRHSELETKPRVAVIYRCPTCRLELQLNAETDRLDVVPVTSDDRDNDPKTRGAG